MNILNYTPHAIMLNDGTVYHPSGTVARVEVVHHDIPCLEDGIFFYISRYGDVVGLPAPIPGTMFIVSSLVLAALNGSRDDVMAPATGHIDVVRDEQGRIQSVPGFVIPDRAHLSTPSLPSPIKEEKEEDDKQQYILKEGGLAAEEGGGMTNTGSATIWSSSSGEPLEAQYIPRRGHLSNAEHALVRIKNGDLQIFADHHRGDFFISVKRVAEIGNDNGERYAVLDPLFKYSEGRWDNTPPERLDAAIDAAKEKALCYHCREPHFIKGVVS